MVEYSGSILCSILRGWNNLDEKMGTLETQQISHSSPFLYWIMILIGVNTLPTLKVLVARTACSHPPRFSRYRVKLAQPVGK
jgi:hypothetical protein